MHSRGFLIISACSHQVKIASLVALNECMCCLFEKLQWTNGGHYFSIVSMTHRYYFISPSVFFSSPQGHFMAPSWGRGSASSPPPSACPPSTPPSPSHSPLRRGSKWRPGRRRPFRRKTLLWVQGELPQQHQLFSSPKTLVQKAHKGPNTNHLDFVCVCVCVCVFVVMVVISSNYHK